MPNIIEIKDFSSPDLDVFARLTEAQLRSRREPEKGIFIAESPKVIGYALGAGCEPVSLLMERRHITGQARDIIARCGDIPVYTADSDLLAGLTGYRLTRGVLCAMRRPQLPGVEDLCAGARRLVILEGIVDPTNVGAIFRSAAALNMDAVLVTPSCCDPLHRRAVRVSMGAIFQVPWTRISGEPPEWPQPGIGRLRSLGFKTVAMALSDAAVSIEDPRLLAEEKLAIVLGTEGDGLPRCTIADCDYTVRIPMSRNVDSLNVAAASAVAFWQLRARSPFAGRRYKAESTFIFKRKKEQIMMSKIDLVRKEMMEALKAKDMGRKDALSMLLSALKAKQIDKRSDLSEEEENAVIYKEIKEAQETMDTSPKDRTDLIEECKFRISVFSEFAPQRMNEEEISEVIRGVLRQLNLTNPMPQDKGKIMKSLMPLVKGKADGALINKLIENMLR